MASNSIKRQRQKRRVDSDGDPEFQVAPMVDVLLVLMLFFMAITSTEVLKKDKNLQLPEANHAKRDEDNKQKKNEIVVNVEWLHQLPVYTLDDLHMDNTDGLSSALATRYRQNPQAHVLIRADQNVEYSSISEIMAACGDAGIQSVSFAAITDPTKANNPAAHAASP